MGSIYKDKSKLNLSIDMILLLLMMPIAGNGFLMKYVLISGIQRNPIYGNNVELKFWGLIHHQWGTIHLVLSIIFLTLLIVHIVFHWKMIGGIFRRMVPPKTIRIVITVFLTAIGLIFISFPLFIKPEIVGREPLHQNMKSGNDFRTAGDTLTIKLYNQNNQAIQESKSNNKEHKYDLERKYEVFGSQTLQFVADKYNLPANKIATDLKIPETLIGDKLGRLKKQYGFTMDDVRVSIAAYHIKH